MTLKKVTIYKHGVGFFEHVKEISGDEEINLMFKPEQINDVLKSFTVSDLNGGYISNISYDTAFSKPNKFNLVEEQTLHSLLNQLVGIDVSFKIGAEKIIGKVIGTQYMPLVVESSNKNSQSVLNMLKLVLQNKTGIEQYSINDIRSFEILSEQVKEEIERLLNDYLEKQKEQKKELKIYCKGKGKRKIVYNYLVESSVWKTSYRFMIGKKKNQIQAWGLLDNQTEEDWRDVIISLVGGEPISFVYDLYSPYQIPRPYVGVKGVHGMAPVYTQDNILKEEAIGDMGFDEESDMEYNKEESPPMARKKVARSAPKGVPSEIDFGVASPSNAMSSVRVSTQTKAVGDLFEYTIKHPITILKDKSASIPIIDKEIKGFPILIYNESVKASNPMSNISITNDTGMTLEEGPMMVVDNGGYAGEAMLPSLKAGEHKYVPYSVELGVNVRKEVKGTSSPIFFAKVVKGYMEMYYYDIIETTYFITNKNQVKKDESKKELIIEHNKDSGYSLKIPEKSFEETENYYRFKVNLASKTGSYKVVQSKETFSAVDLTSLTSVSDVSYYLEQKYIDKKVADQIKSVIVIKQEINAKYERINDIDKRVQELKDDQARIRSNRNNLGGSDEERKISERYLKKLTDHENKIEDLIEEKNKIQDEITSLNNKLNKTLEGINFSVKLK